MLVLDSIGRVIEINQEASRLLESGAGITRGVGGSLVLSHYAIPSRLVEALARLAHDGSQTTETICISRPGELSTNVLVLHLCALPRGAFTVGGRIVAFLYELTQQSNAKLDQGILERVLMLTPMEAKVVLALRGCKETDLAARSLGIAISTVRTHLKHVYSKTNTHRQSELIRLSERLISAAPRH
jgi:DNA-binding CsgD family transcriptional regulator